MTKRSKIKINARRKEQSAERKVKRVQRRLSQAQMEAQIASLEARIALLEEEGIFLKGTGKRDEEGNREKGIGNRDEGNSPLENFPSAGIAFPVPVLARVFAAGPNAVSVHWGGLFNRLRYFWNPVCKLSGTVSRHRHWQPTPES